MTKLLATIHSRLGRTQAPVFLHFRVVAGLAVAALALLSAQHLFAAEKVNLQVTGYQIDADLDPAAHTLKATAKVSVTALDNVSTAVFQLHSALRVNKVSQTLLPETGYRREQRRVDDAWQKRQNCSNDGG